MENSHDHIKLTTGELAVLWGSYMNDSLGICTISYFLKDVEDPDIRSTLEYASELAKKHIEVVTDIFKEEKIPIPTGLTEQDVNLNAPRLYPDTFMLYYIQNMGATGINSYSVALPNAARMDIREFYTSCMGSSCELYNRASNVLQEKGLFIRSPYIPYPSQGEFVHKHHKFLSNDNLLTPMTWDIMPTTSTEPPFSDKLLMFHSTALNNAGIAYYGASLGAAVRKDLAAAYSRLVIKVGEFAVDGVNIMIDNGWLEKPFSAPDRKDLAKS